MPSRREEERERLRQMREQREGSRAQKARRRLLAAYVGAGAVGLIVVAGIVAVAFSGSGSGAAHIVQGTGSTNGFDPDEREGIAPPPVQVANLQRAADRAGCTLRLGLEDEGREHLPSSASTPDYGTNPPTSGNHVESPLQQADGAYSEMPDEIFLVHSLEHGRMQIHYSPELPEEAQLELKGLYDTMYGGTLLFPNDNMDYEVAATTWTNLLGCPEYKGAATLDAIRAFGRQTWGRFGGEGTGPIEGPTPRNPA